LVVASDGAALPPAGPSRSAAVHALVRRLLSQFTRTAPDVLRIARTQAGKPYLEAAHALWFNVSHAHAYSLIAVSRSGEIGCDIEDRFDETDVDRLASLVLHPREAEALERLNGKERQDEFRRYWVAKEALLKAAGSGFLDDPRNSLATDSSLILHERPIDTGCLAAVAGPDADCSWQVLSVSEAG
jgi:phosphopantetheinyl transferase